MHGEFEQVKKKQQIKVLVMNVSFCQTKTLKTTLDQQTTFTIGVKTYAQANLYQIHTIYLTALMTL